MFSSVLDPNPCSVGRAVQRGMGVKKIQVLGAFQIPCFMPSTLKIKSGVKNRLSRFTTNEK